MKKLTAILMIFFSLISCTATKQIADTNFRKYSTTIDEGEPITQSLFADKNATISEENIQKILSGNYTLPPQIRVAILKVDNRTNNRYYSYSWNDEQYLKTQQSYLDLITNKLLQTNRVVSVAAIPELLISRPAGFTNIREAAVRLQADAVVLYSITSDLYSKYKLFTKPDIKAFATTQMLIMDVKTGLIPFSTVVTKDFLSKKNADDLDNNEATNRIQKEAVMLTLQETGEQLSNFLLKK